MLEMDGPRFLRLAERLPFYRGVLRGRIEYEEGVKRGLIKEEKDTQRTTESAPSRPMTKRTRNATEVPLAAIAMQDPDLVEWRQVDG